MSGKRLDGSICPSQSKEKAYPRLEGLRSKTAKAGRSGSVALESGFA